MLRSLSIRDFVIVDRLELEFQAGFTVLTGETGAGKSILIDALALVLGDRGDAGLIRHGAERAEISAEFGFGLKAPLAGWLGDNEFEDEPGVCLMRRVLDRSGRSRGFINGRQATLTQLREAGEFLVDIHGQHQHQSLLRPVAQRALLDAYGRLEDQARTVQAAWRDWQQRMAARIAFERDATALATEREQLEWTLRELETLNLQPDELAGVTAEHGRLAHAAALIEGANEGMESLSDEDGAALHRLDSVISRIEALVEFDPALREVLEVLEPARIQVQEAVYALRHYQQKVELDPGRLREVEARLDAIHAAARKFRIAPEALGDKLVETRARLAALAEGGDIEALRRLEQEALTRCEAEAKSLTAGRRKAAKKLGDEVTKAMQKLAMTGGTFDIALLPEDGVTAHGAETIEFRVSAHEGLPPGPLAKVASGGELSRLSLAIQTVTSQVAEVDTLVFDEVDVGIGGRVAEIVGRMLKALGSKHQVMCITHLPQVAAAGDQQWQVGKSAVDGKVLSRVTPLEGESRVDEIARMLGGVKITDTTRRHAAEMLKLSA